MTGLTLTIQNQALLKAIERGPRVLEKHMRLAVLRSIMEMARDARSFAAKAFNYLTNSIIQRQPSPLVGEVVAGMDYARMVEEGTDPGGWPPEQAMVDWIRVKRIEPNDPSMDERDLAFVMARSIAMKGTPTQPYMQPAFDNNKARAEMRCNAAVDAALREMNA